MYWVQSLGRPYTCGRIGGGLLEVVALEFGHNLWVGLCQRQRGKRDGRAFQQEEMVWTRCEKGTLWGSVCSTGHVPTPVLSKRHTAEDGEKCLRIQVRPWPCRSLTTWSGNVESVLRASSPEEPRRGPAGSATLQEGTSSEGRAVSRTLVLTGLQPLPLRPPLCPLGSLSLGGAPPPPLPHRAASASLHPPQPVNADFFHEQLHVRTPVISVC